MWLNVFASPGLQILGASHERLPFPARIDPFGNSTIQLMWKASTSMAQLQNYLRSNRKRLALSQDEVAFLLGTLSGTQTSRHEMFVREPNLETALAYEAIYQRPVSELFGGLYQEIEKQVVARAKTLTHRKPRGKPTGQTVRKRQTFINIATRQPTNFLKQS
jgi:transcriptional regulator with XRE-family HTH domain